MPRTEEEQLLNSFIYHKLHLKQGKTLEAAVTAGEYLLEVNTDHFTAEEKAETHGEFATQAVHLAITATRREPNFERALDAAHLATAFLVESYPVSQEPADAMRRNLYWEPVFGAEVNAQLRCLRDLVNLIDVLRVIDPASSNVQILQERLQESISSREKSFANESGFLLLQIERGTKIAALRAYASLLKNHGRFLFQHNKKEFLHATEKLLATLVPVLRRTHAQELDQRATEWTKQRGEKTERFEPELLNQLCAIAYIGLGKKIGLLELQSAKEKES